MRHVFERSASRLCRIKAKYPDDIVTGSLVVVRLFVEAQKEPRLAADGDRWGETAADPCVHRSLALHHLANGTLV